MPAVSMSKTAKGANDASNTLLVLRWPLRGSTRLLQESTGRQGRDDDALQGKPGTAAARHGSGRQREQDHAFVFSRRRCAGDGVRRLRARQAEIRGLLAVG